MSRTGFRDVACGLAVALCFTAIAYYYYTGLYCSDDTRYLAGAIKIAAGEIISTASLAERRLVFLLPAAAAHALGAGPDLIASAYIPFFIGAGLAGFALARQLLPSGAGVIAMALAACQPAFFLYAGALLPDLASTAFLTGALVFALRWGDAAVGLVPMAKGMGGSTASAFLIGTCIGIAFALKESGLILLPLPLAAMVLLARQRCVTHTFADLGALSLGLLLVLGCEAIVFRLIAGHWYSSLLSLASPHDMSAFADSQGRLPWARLRTLAGALGMHTSALFSLALLATLRLIHCWRQGALPGEQVLKWSLIVSAWAWPTFYFTFGTTSATAYSPPIIQQRYYAPAVIPAAILAADLGMALWRRKRRGWFSTGLSAVSAGVVLTVAMTAVYAYRHDRGLIYAAEAKEVFRLAHADLRSRFPGVPIHGIQSRANPDLDRCRTLLAPLVPDSTGSPLSSLGGARAGSLLLVGYGVDLLAAEPTEPMAELRLLQSAGRVMVEPIAHYHVLDSHRLDRRSWLPRTFAVAEIIATGSPGKAAVSQANDDSPLESHLEAYLVRPLHSN